MLSLIVCSRMAAQSDLHQRNVAKTVDAAYEYVRVNNAAGQAGICRAYNLGLAQAAGDIFVFMHEDAYFLNPGWGPVLERKFAADPALGLVGVAGTQYLFREHPGWAVAGLPFLRGRVIHDDGVHQNLTVYCRDASDAEVVAADGLFLAIRAELFRRIRFDEVTFDRFHFYDIDMCMQVRQTHKAIVTCDILLKHMSGGSFNAEWQGYAERFKLKHFERLPASCCVGVPDLNNRVGFEGFTLAQPLPTPV
jgi:glycosyltransferase involved in cell wall biosynthesis